MLTFFNITIAGTIVNVFCVLSRIHQIQVDKKVACTQYEISGVVRVVSCFFQPGKRGVGSKIRLPSWSWAKSIKDHSGIIGQGRERCLSKASSRIKSIPETIITDH